MKFSSIEREGIKTTYCGDCGLLGVDVETHECDLVRKFLLDEQKFRKTVTRLDEKFTVDVICETVKKLFVERISRLDSLLEANFARYDDLFAKGVPFTEREKIIDMSKIQAIQGYRERLVKQSKQFKVKKLSDWLCSSDLVRLKRDGFTEFMRFWFETTYLV